MDDKQAMHAMSIDDAYHVKRTLARGPSGVTELVSIDGNGPFVRKKIPSPLAQRNVWAALSACQSNRLPRVEATYELPDRFVIVYDYVPGSTLAQIAEENGRLAPNVAVQLIDQICEAVQELHQHGVIHRDITPANVIVAQDGAHLIDFGLDTTLSALGMPLGMLIFAPLADVIPISLVFIIGGVLTLPIGIYLFGQARRNVSAQVTRTAA